MPSERQIQMYLNFASPISPEHLPAEHRNCPICYAPYRTANVPDRVHGQAVQRPNATEIAVRIQSQKYASTCNHIFGRECIEKHFRSGGSWSNKCPICREAWFPDADEIGTEEDVISITRNAASLRAYVRIGLPREVRLRIGMGGEVGPARDVEEVSSERLSLSLNDETPNQGDERGIAVVEPEPADATGEASAAAQADHQAMSGALPVRSSDATTQAEESEPLPAHGSGETNSNNHAFALSTVRHVAPENVDSDGLSNRGKVHRAIAFLERMLWTVDIDETDAETGQRVLEVERAIERLYMRLADSVDDVNVADRIQGSGWL